MSNIYQYPLKIDKEVIDNIRVYAELDGRSLNKEIEQILKSYAIEREFFDNDIANAPKKKPKSKK